MRAVLRTLFVAIAGLVPLCATAISVMPVALAETILSGPLQQSQLIYGQTSPGAEVLFNGQRLRVTGDGVFIFGFTRDETPDHALEVREPGKPAERIQLTVTPRTYDVQRIDGLPGKYVTPPADVVARIRRENAEIRDARMQNRDEALYLSGFEWPARGRISGIYGSQRILNGEPRRPHFGIDIAAPTGTPVVAPADGIVTLADTDHYYTGGTIILDHGHGLSSALLHMETVAVAVGDRLRKGDPMGTVGAGGRATGPHLDWRINWFDKRLDPAQFVGPME